MINKTQSGTDVLKRLGNILGMFIVESEEKSLSSEVMGLIEQRTQAKKDRDFLLADQLRDRLLDEFGVVLEDTPDGVRWKVNATS